MLIGGCDKLINSTLLPKSISSHAGLETLRNRPFPDPRPQQLQEISATYILNP